MYMVKTHYNVNELQLDQYNYTDMQQRVIQICSRGFGWVGFLITFCKLAAIK